MDIISLIIRLDHDVAMEGIYIDGDPSSVHSASIWIDSMARIHNIDRQYKSRNWMTNRMTTALDKTA